MATGYNWDAPWAEQVSGSIDAPDAGKWKISPLTNNTWVVIDENGVEYTFAFTGPTSGSDVTLTPGADARNVVQPTGDFIALTLKNNAAQATNIFEHLDDADNVLAYLSAAGEFSAMGIEDTPIGTGTPAAGYFSALREVIGGFAGIFTHANSADRTYTLPNFDGILATLAGVETLTNKTLTTPTIASFTNAAHDHSNAAGGGNLSAAVITAGTLALARGGTNADLSATGGSNQFLKQSSSGAAITVGGIVSADLTTALSTPPTIGGGTPGTGVFSSLVASNGAAATEVLTTIRANATNNAVTRNSLFRHNANGTAAAGFGGEFMMRLESSTTDDRDAAYLDWLWNTATDAGAIADLVLGATYNPSGSPTRREGIRIRGGSAATQIGLFGVTPVARATMGAATAGAAYTATEQAMLQAVYDAVRNIGIGT